MLERSILRSAPEEPKRQPDVQAAMSDLAFATDELNEAIHILTDRLGPVLRQELTTKGDSPIKANPPIGGACDLSSSVRIQTDRVTESKWRIRGLLEMLEV